MQFGSDTSPIGLDVGHRRVRAAQFRRRGSSWSVASAVSFTRTGTGSPQSDEAARIVQTLERHAFVGKAAVLASPGSRTRFVTIDAGSGASEAAAAMGSAMRARLELARRLEVDPREVETHCWNTPPAASGRPAGVFGVGLTHSAVQDAVGAMGAAGLEVVAVEPAICAATRGVVAGGIAHPGVVTLIDDDAVEVAVVWPGGVAYARRREDESLAKCAVGGMTPSEVQRAASVVAGEVQEASAYAKHRFRTDAWIRLTGAGSAVPGLADQLGRTLGDVSLDRPCSWIACDEGVPDRFCGHEACVALGLCAERLSEEAAA